MNVSLSPMTLLANPMGIYFYSSPFDYPYNNTGLSSWYGMAVNVRQAGFEITWMDHVAFMFLVIRLS